MEVFVIVDTIDGVVYSVHNKKSDALLAIENYKKMFTREIIGWTPDFSYFNKNIDELSVI